MAFPSVISTLSNPQASDRLNNPSHSTLHRGENTAITEIETFIGLEGASSVLGTLVYDIRSPASNGGGHIQSANTGGTGQTSYNKGDILAGQSSSVLAKLAVGTNGNSLIADSTQAAGVRWGIPGGLPSVITIVTTSVYTVGANRSYIRVQGVGGGGSGSGNTAGSAAGYGESFIPVSSIVSSVLVTIGAPGSVAGNGTNSTFGSIITFGGGIGTNAVNSSRVLGGTVIGAQIQLTGGSSSSVQGGKSFFGGSSVWGAGDLSGFAGQGVVIITEY